MECSTEDPHRSAIWKTVLNFSKRSLRRVSAANKRRKFNTVFKVDLRAQALHFSGISSKKLFGLTSFSEKTEVY